MIKFSLRNVSFIHLNVPIKQEQASTCILPSGTDAEKNVLKMKNVKAALSKIPALNLGWV